MFSVKATYRNETRKFSFPDAALFPTYSELHTQLHRVFPISHSCYLSRLIFSPDASRPGRILVGKEVHSAEDYDSCIAPLRRQWPNPLLRFTIFDETPHKAPNVAPERASLYNIPSLPSSKDKSPFIVAPTSNQFPTPPPPPPPPPQTSVSRSQPPPPPFNIRSLLASPPSPPSTKPFSPCEFGTAGKTHCCSVAKGKADIESLLSSFKVDLDHILSTTFGTDYAEKQRTTFVPGVSNVHVPSQGNTPVIPDTNVRWCFVCKASFTGVWYGCVKCPWHAVCPNCFSESHEAHTLSFGPSHVVQQRNGSTRVSTKEAQPRVLPPMVPPPAGEPASAIHRGVICDSCEKIIVGVRHKCLDCPDYDLCTVCVESGGMGQHNPFHEFFDIKAPKCVYVHTAFGDGRNRSLQRSRAPATQQEAVARPIRHSATCNLCDSAIVGERYKCVTCPDFDTCSSCFSITAEQHPSHGFVKLRKPEDLMIRDSLPRRHIAHSARCDLCRKMIHGARYKCMHPSCPDFDLCSNCEALPIAVHPLNHPMLKMKSPDTVIPIFCGQVQASIGSNPVPVCDESRFSESPAVPVKTPELAPVVSSSQDVDAPAEDKVVAEEFLSPLGSPASNALGTALIPVNTAPSHLLVDAAERSPQSIHSPLDIYYQLWPKVNQEMARLNAGQALEAGKSVADPVEDTVTESIVRHPLYITEEPSTRTPVTLSASQQSEHDPICPVTLASGTKSIDAGYRTPSPVPLDDHEPYRTAEQLLHQEVESTSASQQSRPTSMFVNDTNVPDGQVFPPGAEFVKGWHMKNNGEIPWPVTTEIQFVAGDKFAPEGSAALRAKVGTVQSGQDLDIWTGDLKAPDTPGRYVGYWRLNDGQGNFGSNVWIDLTVAHHEVSEHSLAASSMVMPSTNSDNASAELHAPRPSLPSTKTITDEVEDPDSDVSSVSLVSMPTSDDEEAEWQDTRTHSEPLEYVVLYGERSEE